MEGVVAMVPHSIAQFFLGFKEIITDKYNHFIVNISCNLKIRKVLTYNYEVYWYNSQVYWYYASTKGLYKGYGCEGEITMATYTIV